MRSRATRADPAKARRPARALGLGATIAAAAAAAVAAATLFAPAPARAAEGCPIPAMAGPALAGVEPTRRLAWIEDFFRDLTYSCRSLRSSPVFAVSAAGAIVYA